MPAAAPTVAAVVATTVAVEAGIPVAAVVAPTVEAAAGDRTAKASSV